MCVYMCFRMFITWNVYVCVGTCMCVHVCVCVCVCVCVWAGDVCFKMLMYTCVCYLKVYLSFWL